MSDPTPEDWDIAFEIMTNDPRAGDIARTRAEAREPLYEQIAKLTDECEATKLCLNDAANRRWAMARKLRLAEGARIWNAWTAIIALLITEQAMDDCEPYRWREYLALPSASDAIKRAYGSSKQDE